MCEIKIVRIYVCPICNKQYKRKGYYLNKHLKGCGAIAWKPMIKTEIIMNRLDEEKLSLAIEKLISGEFSANITPIERIKRDAKKDKSKRELPVFKEYKERLMNGEIQLTHVPENELSHIYNIMVSA